MTDAKTLSAVRDAFVAEFGQHAAEHSETGRLLGLGSKETAAEPEADPEPEAQAGG